MSKIYINNLTKEYSNKKVVNSFEFCSFENEFIVVVGPSGCGKTTLLRLISGLEKPTEGSIYIDEKILNDTEPKDRSVSMVFQNYALYPTMNVFENIAFPLVVNKEKPEIINEKVTEMAKKLELLEMLDRKPKSLSGGEKQRVAIGRAMIRNPKIFLFDEPLSNLDALIRDKMRNELKNLHKKINAVFIYVTHDQIEAMSMGDRIIVMKDGIIQQIDTPSNIYNHPANLFVAEFIGAPKINIINDKSLYKWLVGNDKNYKNNIIYTTRPESITIRKSSTKDDGKVILMENLGKEVRYHVEYNNNIIVICNMIDNLSNLIHEDEYVICSVVENKLLLFDKETGNRI